MMTYPFLQEQEIHHAKSSTMIQQKVGEKWR